MPISTLYLCNATVSIAENEETIFDHGGRFFLWNLIFIFPSCLSYFKCLYLAKNFCFEELRKFLSEKYLRKEQNLTFPIEFQRLT